MPRRTGEPQRLGGSERLPAWRVSLSEEPTAEWRREFLRLALTSGIFQNGQIAVEADALVFELEQSALGVTCDMLDQWIVRAHGKGVAEAGRAGEHVATILIVDDQPDVGPLAEDILEPEGYAVVHTTDPMEAIRVAKTRPGDIDLLLVDIVMPLMDGRELARRILALRPNMKVILMSGYEVSGTKEAGATFLQKPFGVEPLRRIVSDTLRGHPTKQARGPFASPP
jgi:CheY-like chemotaxis protein